MRETGIFGTLDPFYEGGDVMGRKVANAAFLKALLAADPFAAYHFFPPSETVAGVLRRDLSRDFPDLVASGRVAVLHRLELPQMLQTTRYHCFHLSDCLLSQPHLARLRSLHAPERFPVTGGIHSLSRSDTPLAFAQHFWPGVCPRDAVVCTSTAGRATVRAMLDDLRRGLGLDPARLPDPRLELIPLGVDASALRPATPEARAAARAEIGAGEGETVFLALGRLEHHSKMDLLPLLRAFQRAFASGLAQAAAHLVLAGWAEEDDEIVRIVRALAANLGLRLSVVLKPAQDRKLRLLAAADVLVSPSDNCQETFGLTLLEAGASGLPVLASDWDGYRDIVVHGETGLLAPTVGPSDTAGVDALSRLVADNQYHLLLAQRTAVDVAALADGLVRLACDADLRARMGAAARARIEERFTWDGVVRGHLSLWERLWEEPAGNPAGEHPLQPHFARAFAGHPTRSGLSGLTIRRSRSGEAAWRGQEHPLIYAGVSHVVTPERLHGLLVLARAPLEGAELSLRAAKRLSLPAEEAEALVLWALKQGFLEFS
ncbi:glycosyl transferase group 1 [Desulfovibrio sp. X2]|uniref:glycosyltransferase family 4 protein n=1 Tax=Desulfovibrio sp. X2 TaxID=941449 RepID=UPI00035875EC|nr:glycosyltransferase family 4 protein [Desulfovibrio sp. X2]EPR37555.1 glycosyl transferase group 1 [Desulfovibrio sp. X2]